MKSRILHQVRNFIPITLIILVGTLTRNLWMPYLVSGDKRSPITIDTESEKKRAPTSHAESTSDDDDVAPMAALPSKVAFQSAELQSLDSQTLTPKPNEVPPPAEDAPFLPNRKRTPGAIFTGATREIICVPGYTKKVRHVPLDVKKAVYNSYGIKHHIKGEYEVDHLIPLELGGSNDVSNLWPQPYQGQWNAHTKDKEENELHHRVCAGTIPLALAQKEISFDWVAAYKKYVGEK